MSEVKTYTLREWLKKFPADRYTVVKEDIREFLALSTATFARRLNQDVSALSDAERCGIADRYGVPFPTDLEEINPALYYTPLAGEE